MDWSMYFHEEIPELDETSRMLRNVLLNKKWQEKLLNRTAAFYEIISKLVELMHGQIEANSGT